MVRRPIKTPPPYLQQYGSGRHYRRRRKRPTRRRGQIGGNILDALSSNRLASILKSVRSTTPLVLDQVIAAQGALSNSRKNKKAVQQKGGFGPMAAMLGAQFAMPLLTGLINKL